MSLDGDPWGPQEAAEAAERQRAHLDQSWPAGWQDDIDTALLVALCRVWWP